MVEFKLKGYALFIDDEKHVRLSGAQTLQLDGFQVTSMERAQDALHLVEKGWSGIVISDVKMPEMDGLEFLDALKKINPDIPVIMITGHGDVNMAVQALHMGAYDFVEKPFASERLLEVAARAIEKHDLLAENKILRQKLESGDEIESRLFGKSPALENLRATLRNIAPTDTDILIIGETGTGKELVARCLHDHSARCNEKFVALNCAAMPETIFESELFGHEPGAFPNNPTRRIGKIEYANAGTLFLDEIENLPLELQVKLLRFLQERAIQRLGSNEEIQVDLRVIAASKTDLMACVQAGTFREDLYYRLSIMQIDTPPLREAREDIPYLFRIFSEECAQRLKRAVPEFSQDLQRDLLDHDWPGNIRELKNRAERHILSPGPDPNDPISQTARTGLADKVEAFEKSLIIQALEQTEGSIKDAMIILDLPRKTLSDKMRKFNINRNDFIIKNK